MLLHGQPSGQNANALGNPGLTNWSVESDGDAANRTAEWTSVRIGKGDTAVPTECGLPQPFSWKLLRPQQALSTGPGQFHTWEPLGPVGSVLGSQVSVHSPKSPEEGEGECKNRLLVGRSASSWDSPVEFLSLKAAKWPLWASNSGKPMGIGEPGFRCPRMGTTQKQLCFKKCDSQGSL